MTTEEISQFSQPEDISQFSNDDGGLWDLHDTIESAEFAPDVSHGRFMQIGFQNLLQQPGDVLQGDLDDSLHDNERLEGRAASFDRSIRFDDNGVGTWDSHDSSAPSHGVIDDGFVSVDGNASSCAATVLDPTADVANFDHAGTQSALSQMLEPSKPKFLWEQNSFLNAVFGSGNIVDELFKGPTLKRPPTALVDLTVDDEPPIKKAAAAGRKNPVFLKAIRQSSLMHEETKRLNYISGWTSVVLTNVFAFGAFDRARAECSDDGLRAKIHRTVLECLACKATSTIGKRLGSMQRYLEFCAANSICAFPLDDTNMYMYLSNLVDRTDTLASSGKSFVEAVRFTNAMLGLRSEDVRLISWRVSGLAEMLMKRAPVVAQASPLTADHVRKLEQMCCNSESLQDRILLGGILLMVFGCARSSDMSRVARVLIDCDTRHESDRDAADPVGYIGLSVVGHKGAHSSTHKRMILPVVAPMISVSGLAW
eukprot:s612_g38.t1